MGACVQAMLLASNMSTASANQFRVLILPPEFLRRLFRGCNSSVTSTARPYFRAEAAGAAPGNVYRRFKKMMFNCACEGSPVGTDQGLRLSHEYCPMRLSAPYFVSRQRVWLNPKVISW